MEITINDHRKIYAIQNEFAEGFPFLKLEFFSKPSKEGGSASQKPMKHISKTIAECRTIHSSGHISIHSHMTVGEVKQNFEDVYGLSVAIFRKAEDGWEEITDTANWTLERQNEEGMELSKKYTPVTFR